MKTACLAVAVAMFPCSIAHAEAPQLLLEKYRCNICHADREPKAAPAYVDIADRYRANPKAEAIVTAVVKKGEHGGGPWHMPPHPEVTNTEARAMARYILSLK